MLLENRQQPRHGIRGNAGGLQSERVGIQESAKVVRPPSELIGDVVERLIRLDWAREQASDRHVVVALSERAGGRISPLELRRVEIEAHHPRAEIRSGPS